MNSMKKFTTRGIVACVFMALVVIFTLFSNMFVLGGEILEQVEVVVKALEDDLDYYDTDDLEEYFEELGYDGHAVEAGVKLGKFFYGIEDGKFSAFDIISGISCFSAMKKAPELGLGMEGTTAISVILILAIVLTVVYLAIPLLGILYLVLHFLGRKNKGVPVLVLLAAYVGLVGGITTLITLANEIKITISFLHVIALGFAIASVALWKVEKTPQLQMPYQAENM